MKCTANPPPGELCALCGLVHVPIYKQPKFWIVVGIIVVVGIIAYSLYRSDVNRRWAEFWQEHEANQEHERQQWLRESARNDEVLFRNRRAATNRTWHESGGAEGYKYSDNPAWDGNL